MAIIKGVNDYKSLGLDTKAIQWVENFTLAKIDSDYADHFVALKNFLSKGGDPLNFLTNLVDKNINEFVQQYVPIDIELAKKVLVSVKNIGDNGEEILSTIMSEAESFLVNINGKVFVFAKEIFNEKFEEALADAPFNPYEIAEVFDLPVPKPTITVIPPIFRV